MDEVRAPNVSHNVSSAEFLSEQASSKKTDLREGPDTRPRVPETKPTRVGKPEANPITLTERPVYFTKRTIPALERKRRIIPSGPTHARKYLSSANLKKWLQNWYVISIKMNGKLMQLYIGIR